MYIIYTNKSKKGPKRINASEVPFISGECKRSDQGMVFQGSDLSEVKQN